MHEARLCHRDTKVGGEGGEGGRGGGRAGRDGVREGGLVRVVLHVHEVGFCNRDIKMWE